MVEGYLWAVTLAAVVLFPLGAWRRWASRRTHFVVWAVLGVLFAVGFTVLTPTADEVAVIQNTVSASRDAKVGVLWLYEYAPTAAAMWGLVGIAAFLGAVAFRPAPVAVRSVKAEVTS